MSWLIRDGYTKHVGIEAVDGLHPEMTFVYRPFAGNEASDTLMKIRLGPTATGDPRKRKDNKITAEQQPKEVERRMLDTLLARIKQWNFADPEAPELDRAGLKQLPAPLFTKVHNIIFGYETPDFEMDAAGERVEPADPEQDAGN